MRRRSFLMTASGALAAASASSFPAAAAQSGTAPSDRINVAVIGLRGRGRDHLNLYAAQRDARIAAICDIDDAQLERATALTRQLNQPDPTPFKDFRRLLDNKDIHAVSIATPNHWHALMTVWACQAGKDVYVEKPASHTLWEGRKMVEAARKYSRVVQVGMQSRTTHHKIKAVQRLRDGAIGQLYMAKGLCYKRRLPIGVSPDGSPPPGVDYDTWLGPAQSYTFNEKKFHYNWHWFWATGNGDIGNQGVHEMDIARWGLGKDTLPRKVHSNGGLFGSDDQETPNTQLAEFEYGDALLTFEVRGLLTGGEGDLSREGPNYIGNLFFGTKGWMSLDLDGYKIYTGEKNDLLEEMKYTESSKWDTGPHVENFLHAVRTRNSKDLNADILEGHLSAGLVHMANISYRTGRKLVFDPNTETFPGDPEANALLKRNYRAPYTMPDPV
jgi:predicted dehydrogenase